MKNKTVEPQYKRYFEVMNKKNPTKLGLSINQAYEDDPIRITFMTSRYKFVSKMFLNFKKVLEIGCSDGFLSRIVKQNVSKLDAIDFDKLLIEDAIRNNKNLNKKYKIKFMTKNILKEPIKNKYNGVYALDVFEHVSRQNEKKFLLNITKSLSKDGVLIIGTPSLESQKYASKISKEGHINCKSGIDLKNLLKKYFNNVFLFSMNDEVVHTGFNKMAHYLFAICCFKK